MYCDLLKHSPTAWVIRGVGAISHRRPCKELPSRNNCWRERTLVHTAPSFSGGRCVVCLHSHTEFPGELPDSVCPSEASTRRTAEGGRSVVYRECCSRLFL